MTQNDLLSAGMRHFLDAQYAVNRFQAEIGEIAANVLRKNIDELAKSLKVQSPHSDKISTAYWPNVPDLKYDGSTSWLGAQAWFDSPISSTFFVGLEFARDGQDKNNIKSAVGYATNKKKTYNLLKSSFMKSENTLYDSPEELSVGFCQKISTTGDINKELQDIFDKFTEYWRDQGGWTKVAPG